MALPDGPDTSPDLGATGTLIKRQCGHCHLGACSASATQPHIQCRTPWFRSPSLSVASPRLHIPVALQVSPNGASRSCRMPPCVSVVFRIEVVRTNPIRRDVE